MDDWRYPTPDADETPLIQPARLAQGWHVIDARVRAHQAEATRVAEFGQAQAFRAGGNPATSDIPLPFATSPGAAPTF